MKRKNPKRPPAAVEALLRRQSAQAEQALGAILGLPTTHDDPTRLTVPLVLDLRLAGLMMAVAQETGSDIMALYNTVLAHGLYHMAREAGASELKRASARLMRQMCPSPKEWDAFAQRHPAIAADAAADDEAHGGT